MNSEVPPPPSMNQQRTSGLAIASMVCGLLSCLCVPAPVAMVLGIVALVQMGKDPNLKGKGFAIAGIVLPVVMSLLILPAIAIPNFMKFQARSKQSECRINLKAISVAQRSYEAEHNELTDNAELLNWQPDGKRRYSYVFSSSPAEPGGMIAGDPDDAPTPQTIRDALSRPLAGGAQIGLNDGVWTGVCAGNIDRDDTMDVWSISSADRDGPKGKIAAWELYNDVSDIEE
jgi:type IV pilus assembly protein PilA